MTEKKFHIATPKQLQEISQFIKSGNVSSLISVWNASINRKGTSPWDHSIYAVFCAKTRKAFIARRSGYGEVIVNYDLKYNAALKWCKENLLME